MASDTAMRSIDIGRIFLDLENPRHEPYDSESQVIDYLCRYENVLPLARDIAKFGLNPWEMLAVIPDDDSAPGADKGFIAAEGNRRLCACKLLDDPDRAPAKFRKQFEELALEYDAPEQLTCMIFADKESVRMWLGRIHEGQQGGIGRKQWNADQTARHSGSSKNKIALAVLDYAEEAEFISPEGRRGKLTTVQRYLVSAAVRDALGIDASDLNNIRRNRPKAEFDTLLQRFLADLASGYVNSRSNKEQHEAYARELSATQGQSHQQCAPEPFASEKPKPKSPATVKPKKRKPRRIVPFEQEIMDRLEALGGDKLPSLYNSICSVPLDVHTPLVSIGAWAFLESLSAKAGRNVDTDFLSFFSKERLQRYGLPTGKSGKALAEALRHLSHSGDVTKHDPSAAFFNSEQLINDLETLKELIVQCADEAAEA